MDKNQEEILKKNLEEFYELAEFAFGKEKYNAAAALYYKALVEICDLVLLKEVNKIGANHNERFRMLELHKPELYDTARKLFRFYRDSYSKQISKIIVESMRKNVEESKRMV
ncbi:MAG: hypothetical protein KKE20_05120 [Nanoarchaeota archaeon]|nr:hypothetical protein [Nanoarchaeota archaeon]